MTAPTAAGSPPGSPPGSPTPPPPVWPRPAPVRGWAGDLLFGARLVRGGNRSGRLRVALTAVGIGVTVTLLLFAASVGHIRAAQQHRANAAVYDPVGPLPGVDPLRILPTQEPYAGHDVRILYVRATGPRAPLPPGLARVPGPGEQVVSPALARLLAGPDGGPVRARFPAATIGTIGPAGLPGGPGDLTAWVGSADVTGEPVYYFGTMFPDTQPLPPLLWTLILVGLVVLLVPMFVLVAAVSRLSAVDRRRRLAAIRLVGAGARQIRRISAGEVLAGAVGGLLAGAALFLALRAVVEIEALGSVAVFGGVRPFSADVTPAWPLVVLIAVLVPGLAVVTAVLALRRTLVEPLDVVRQSTPPQRRLLWRLLPGAAGIGLLVLAERRGDLRDSPATTPVLVAGTALVLLFIPLVLPWLVHRLVRRPRDETPALQLAARRLQLDSGPAARLTAGTGVALAGAIGLSALLGAAAARYAPAGDPQPADRVLVELVPPVDAAGLLASVRSVPGVTTADPMRRLPLSDGTGAMFTALVAPCPVLRTLAPLPSCVDGGRYGSPGFDLDRPAEVVTLPDGGSTPYRVALPPGARPLDPAEPQLLLTPGAVRSIPARYFQPALSLRLDPGDPGATDRVRAALAVVGWRADVETRAERFRPDPGARDFVAIRRALFAGALLTLTLAAVALLVLCLQQIRDARRPLAALAAAGVPRAVLARSLVWQNAILAIPALVLADAVGIALGALLLPISSAPATVDWPTVATLTAAALVTVAVTTTLVLPAVRAATRPSGLRTE